MIVATPVINQASYKSWTITALDADTTLTFAHGMNGIPDNVEVNVVFPYAASTAYPFWSASAGATNITISKLANSGSGGTTPGTTVIAKVIAMLPNTSMQ